MSDNNNNSNILEFFYICEIVSTVKYKEMG